MATLYQARWTGTVDPHGTTVLWRALTWKEFKTVLNEYGHLDLTDTNPMDLYIKVYEQVVIAGPHPEQVTAGIARYVALHQLRDNPFSGSVDPVISKLVEKRTWLANDYLEGVRGVVGATFHVPFEVMDEWTPDQLFERLAQAEYAVGAQFNPSDPRQAKQDKTAPNQQQPLSPRHANYLKTKERRRVADLEESGSGGSPASEQFSWGR